MVELKQLTKRVFSKEEFRIGTVTEKHVYEDVTLCRVEWEDGAISWYGEHELIFWDEFVGKKVRFTGEHDPFSGLHLFYPFKGSLGTVVKIGGDGTILVQWEEGTTTGDGRWFCLYNDVEIIEEDKEQKEEYTDEEVWEFLKPKMRQHSDVPLYSYSKYVRDMVVAAYRSGYGRASKGRPFKIGDKK